MTTLKILAHLLHNNYTNCYSQLKHAIAPFNTMASTQQTRSNLHLINVTFDKCDHIAIYNVLIMQHDLFELSLLSANIFVRSQILKRLLYDLLIFISNTDGFGTGYGMVIKLNVLLNELQR